MNKIKQEVYLDVADHIKRFIVLGIYDSDSLLPSCRKLALELGVNPNTVQKAYEYLEKEGVVYSLPKKGYLIQQPEKKKVKDLKILKDSISHLLDLGFTKEEIIDELQKEREND